MADGMKKCPKCAEDIKEEAIVCKHCGADLSQKSDKKNKIDDFVTFFLTNTNGFSKNSVEYDLWVVKLIWPKSDFSFLIFILLMFIYGLGLIYLIYHWVKKPCFVTVKFDDAWWPSSVSSNTWTYSFLVKKYLKQSWAPDSLTPAIVSSNAVSPIMAVAIISIFLLVLGILPILFMDKQVELPDRQEGQLVTPVAGVVQSEKLSKLNDESKNLKIQAYVKDVYGYPHAHLRITNNSKHTIDLLSFSAQLFNNADELQRSRISNEPYFGWLSQDVLLPWKTVDWEWQLSLFPNATKIGNIRITKLHYKDTWETIE